MSLKQIQKSEINIGYFFCYFTLMFVLLHEISAKNESKFLNILMNNDRSNPIPSQRNLKVDSFSIRKFRARKLLNQNRPLKHDPSNIKPKKEATSQKKEPIKQNHANLKPAVIKNVNVKFVNRNVTRYVRYQKDLPLIWVMGPPRSGTSLLRVLLDAHTDVRCSEESGLITRLFRSHRDFFNDAATRSKLEEANINEEVLLNAMGAYILSVVSLRGEATQWMCSAEPELMPHADKLHRMFPNSKFVLMVRDGRAVVQSISNRRLGNPMLSINPAFHRANLHHWSEMTSDMVEKCKSLGLDVCRMVKYERLVLQPTGLLTELLSWLGVPFDRRVLRHEETIGQPGGVTFSGREHSTEDLKKPINLLSLYKWAENFPEKFKEVAYIVGPMLEQLGYDPVSYPPDYGQAEEMVQKNTQRLKNTIL